MESSKFKTLSDHFLYSATSIRPIHKLRRLVDHTCLHCSTDFRGIKQAKYCSDKCRYDAANERRRLAGYKQGVKCPHD